MAAGKLCKGCKTKAPFNCPTKNQPSEVDCPTCEGTGCAECRDVGHFELTSCVRPSIPSIIWETMSYANMLEQGHMPTSGGVLDQTRWFIDAANFIQSEWNKLEKAD